MSLDILYIAYGTFLPTYERHVSILPHNSNQQKETSTKVTSSCPSNVEPSSQLGGPITNRSLKIRLKVGFHSTTLNNSAIHRSLGLDEDSPLSSSDNSSGITEGLLPPLPRRPADESPTKIIEAMTSFPVPSEALLSPLHDSLIELSMRESLNPLLSLEKKKDRLIKQANETTLKQNDTTLVQKKRKLVDHKNDVRATDIYRKALNERDKDRGSMKNEKREFVGEKKLKVLQTAESEKERANKRDSFKGKDVIERASSDFRKVKGPNDKSSLKNQQQESMKNIKQNDTTLVKKKNRAVDHKTEVRASLGNGKSENEAFKKVRAKKRDSRDLLRKVEGPNDRRIKTFKSSKVVEQAEESMKKRKLKDWQDDQNSHNSAINETLLLKEENCERSKKKKKPNVEEISKDEVPKMQDNKIFRKQTSVGKEELLKRNLGARQVSAVANSKAKSGVKVSPAEPVSSFPLRTSGLDQFEEENEEITSIEVGDSRRLIVDVPKGDHAVESKTLKNLGTAGKYTSNLDKAKSSDQTVGDTLKEAKKLRDIADKLNNVGPGVESNEFYFQSALKYLHGAFLLETLNNATGEHGDTTPIKFYRITAELCERCALEYEPDKEMVAATLAFKCMEVAYLRIVYHKHSSINGDRLQMQSSFRTIMQGESPSSSASSDVDNLSNQGVTDNKSTFTGNHIWNSGNCTSFGRVLDFVRDTNSAMEASRKSRNAFVAASSSVSEGKDKDYVVASVKKVIDFNFQDAGELVQLVRVAMETITHSGFSK